MLYKEWKWISIYYKGSGNGYQYTIKGVKRDINILKREWKWISIYCKGREDGYQYTIYRVEMDINIL